MIVRLQGLTVSYLYGGVFVNSVRGAVDVRPQIYPRLPDGRFQCVIIGEVSRLVLCC